VGTQLYRNLIEAQHRRRAIEEEEGPAIGEYGEFTPSEGPIATRARAEERGAGEALRSRSRYVESEIARRGAGKKTSEQMSRYWPAGEATGGSQPGEVQAKAAGIVGGQQARQADEAATGKASEAPKGDERIVLGRWGKIAPGDYNRLVSGEAQRLMGAPGYESAVAGVRGRAFAPEIEGEGWSPENEAASERLNASMSAAEGPWGGAGERMMGRVPRGSQADIGSRLQLEDVHRQQRASELESGAQDVEALKQAATTKQLEELMKMPTDQARELQRSERVSQAQQRYQSRLDELSKKYSNYQRFAGQTPGKRGQPVGESEDSIDQVTLKEEQTRALQDLMLAMYAIDRQPQILQALAGLKVDPRLIEQAAMAQAMQPQATRTAEGE
jgi:hypothetical protein